MSNLKDKIVLVTGGTGSFGKAFCKKALDEGAKKVIVLSRDELKQYDMAQEITDPRMRYFLGDVRDLGRLQRAFSNVDYVVHAAALKQVPAGEYNTQEFTKTNVYGSENVINAAIDCGVTRVVGLSTDKAVNPINNYGATKLCMEKAFLGGNNYSTKTRFSIVRYGNVVGSRGSVIPLFMKQKEAGNKYTVTHNDMSRFWIKMDQAVSLVIDTLNSVSVGVFVPNIPSASVVDIVYAVSEDPPIIKITGIRPGEKIHETLVGEEDWARTQWFGNTYTTLFIPSEESINWLKRPLKGPFCSNTNPWRLTVDEIRQALTN